MFRILLSIRRNLAPSCLDFVIEANPVDQFMATVEGYWSVGDVTDPQQLVDTDICGRSTLDVK